MKFSFSSDSPAYSFDVYDTVITRVVENPIDVFRLLQKRALEAGYLQHDTAKSVFDARIWSEFLARRLTKNEDVTLEEIYVVVRRVLSLDEHQAKQLMLLELDIESQSSCTISNVASIILQLKSNGSRIIYISDMYLPSSFIVDILRAYNLFDDLDAIYVSGETGVTKGSGHLFDHVLKNEGIVPEYLFHIGDNPYSDVLVPSKKNIRTLHMRNSHTEFSVKLLKMQKTISYLLQVIAAKVRLGLRLVV